VAAKDRNCARAVNGVQDSLVKYVDAADYNVYITVVTLFNNVQSGTIRTQYHPFITSKPTLIKGTVMSLLCTKPALLCTEPTFLAAAPDLAGIDAPRRPAAAPLTGRWRR
jgi:hypothetical protein